MLHNNSYLLQSPKTIFDKGVTPGHITPTKLKQIKINTSKKNLPAHLILPNSVKMPELFLLFLSPPCRSEEGRGERIYSAQSCRFSGTKSKFHINSSFFITTNSLKGLAETPAWRKRKLTVSPHSQPLTS